MRGAESREKILMKREKKLTGMTDRHICSLDPRFPSIYVVCVPVHLFACFLCECGGGGERERSIH